jgi:hypothetical protein
MLDGNGVAYADGQPLPRRLGVWFWGNGMRRSEWIPDTDGLTWDPSSRSELAPLAHLKDDFSLVTGLEVKLTGRDHVVGMTGMLTGSYQMVDADTWTVTRPSLDQLAARAWQGQTRLRSLELGVATAGEAGAFARGDISWNGPGSVNPAEQSPAALFERLFQRQLMRKSVLDLVAADAAKLQQRVGAADRQRLEAHLDGIRQLEGQLAALPPACIAPLRPGTFPIVAGREQLEAVNRAMADLLALALACDLTRAFTFQFTARKSDALFWQVGASNGLHTLTHNEDLPQPQVHATVVFTMQQLAYLIGKLRGLPEGAGTLLDRCAILATSEHSEGFTHSTNEMPVLVFGRAGGALRTGLHYRSTTAENTSSVGLTLLRAVGVPADAFGADAGWTQSELGALRG